MWRFWDKKKNQRRTYTRQHKQVWSLYDNYLVDDFLLLWVVLPERNNFPPKNFILPESETDIFHENRNINSPWGCHDAQQIQLCKNLSHFWALAVFGSFQVSQTRSRNGLPFNSLISKEYGGKANKEKPIFIGEGNKRTHVFVEHLDQTQNFSMALFVTVSYLDHPHCPSMGAKKAQPVHNCTSAPKDKTMNRDLVYSICLKLVKVVVQMHVL